MEEYEFLTDKPIVEVEQTVGWEYALEAARFTQGKEPLYKDGKLKMPSEKFIKSSLMAEHSQIKIVQYKVVIKNLAQWCGVHLLRHGFQTPFICSQRNDRNESVEDIVKRILSELLELIKAEEPNYNSRNLLPQGTRNNHMFWMNAQTVINISKKRICREASRETQEVWRMVVEAISKVDPILPLFCVPTCVYRGFCPEIKCCGFCLTKAYNEKLINYRTLIPNAEERKS